MNVNTLRATFLDRAAAWITTDGRPTTEVSVIEAIDAYYHRGPAPHSLETLVDVDAYLNKLYGYDDSHSPTDPEIVAVQLEQAALLDRGLDERPVVVIDQKKLDREVNNLVEFLSRPAKGERSAE